MPDARGHGETEVPEKDFSYDNMIEDVEFIIEKLGLKRPILVVHSMGAMTAVYFASTYPELVRAIRLEDPGFQLTDASKIKRIILKLLMRLFLLVFLRGSYGKLLNRGRKQNPKWSEEELIPWTRSKIHFKKKIPKNFKNISMR